MPRYPPIQHAQKFSEDALEIQVFGAPRSQPTFFKGEVRDPWIPPQKARRVRVGQNFAFLISHRSEKSAGALVVSSAGIRTPIFDGIEAEIVLLSVGVLGRQSDAEIEQYWTHTVRAFGAAKVILTNWEDFRRPLGTALQKIPFPPVQVSRALHAIDKLAEQDGLEAILPQVF